MQKFHEIKASQNLNKAATPNKELTGNDKAMARIKQAGATLKGKMTDPIASHHVHAAVHNAPGKATSMGLKAAAGAFKSHDHHLSSPIAQFIGGVLEGAAQSNLGNETSAREQKDRIKRTREEHLSEGKSAYNKHIADTERKLQRKM
ncbi:hypothetical protein [Helicobacter heilmannii]|uniref:Uncharacterized protein n=2 Tax=Helicobacter TaxID=209 RepID=A0A0K2Y8Z1_HELHE|nr:hypothetical protein [Helicobacter heilmannii]BDQ28142.1 hypothetical protein ASB1_18180 [Helicobacter heilmannii]CRF45891.1 hypothetical protein HHE014_08700 [Helicobacter heilmannii]CRI35328.1 hypothetical protein HHE01_03260 [Helicobacter heilmannii]